MTRADAEAGVWRAYGIVQLTGLLFYDARLGWIEHWMRTREQRWGVEFAVPWAHLLVPDGAVLALSLTLLLGARWLSRLASGAAVDASSAERTPASAIARHVIRRLLGVTCVFYAARSLAAFWPSIVYEWGGDYEDYTWAGDEWGPDQWTALAAIGGWVLLGAILFTGPARVWRWIRANFGPVPTHD